MSTKQKSVSIDDEQKIEIFKYMEYHGIKSFSGGIHSLIHRGLRCKCSISNHGGGVSDKEKVSNAEKKQIPKCIGKPGDGFCEKCNYTTKCANMFAKKGLNNG